MVFDFGAQQIALYRVQQLDLQRWKAPGIALPWGLKTYLNLQSEMHICSASAFVVPPVPDDS